MEAAEQTVRRAGYPLVLGFAVLSLGIVTGGTLYYRHYERQFRGGIEQQLSAIAELKVDELAQYRKERLGDASIFFNNAAFSGLVRRFLNQPEDTEVPKQLRAWLDKYQNYYQYDRVFLLDTQGVERIATPVTTAPVSAVVAGRIAEVLQARTIAFEDFHRNEHNGQIYLTLLVPIFDEADHDRALGVLALRIDPAIYLYPFISRWPTPSRTAETLLVRREGNEAVFLNEIKFQTNTALTLRIPLDQTDRPAVKAALGQEGIVEGRDYRNVPVIADVRAVPNSPWFLVARIDIAEVDAPLHERLWMIILLVGVLLLAAGAGAGALWRHQRIRFYKQQSKVAMALRESQALYHSLVEQLPAGVFRKDPAGRYVFVNSWFCRLKDTPVEEFLGKSPGKVAAGPVARQDPMGRTVKYAAAGEDHHEQIMQTGKPVELIEEYVNADGRKQFVRAVKLPVFDSDGKVIGSQGILFDITEIKQAAEALHYEQTLMTTLMQSLPDPVYFKDAASCFIRVNPAMARRFGLSDPSQAVGKTDTDFFTDEHASKALADEQAIIRTGQPLVNMEEKETWPDGSETWVLTTKLPLRDDAGRIIGTCGISSNITERKRAEEVVRQSEERLLKVLTQTRCILNFGQVEGPAGWRERALNPDTPFRWDFPVQNEEAAQKVVPLKLEPGERYQQAWTRSRSRADHVQMNWNSGNAFLNDLPVYRNEFRCVDKNGVGHWMQQYVTVRKLEENRWQVFGITMDISDLKRIETELRQSQALYQSLVDQMPAGIFRKDPEGRYVFVNSAFCRLKDMTPDQFLGSTALELALPDAALKNTGADHHATILQTGRQIEVDEVYYSADGEKRNYHVVKSPVFDSAGKIIGTQGILFDITDRKQAEEALHLGETRLHVILESTADGILAVDSKGKVITANRRFAELWRIPQPLLDAGDDRALLDFARGQLSDPDAFLKKVQSLYDSNAVEMDTLTFKDDRVFERFTAPMMMEAAVIGRVWAFRDITDRKRQERELHEKNAELERFTYTVSHDLKSPLVTVKTFLGFLVQDLARSDAERVKQDVTYMHNAMDKMGLLLDELLNLARVGRKSNPPARVAFQELAQEAVRLVAGRISTGGVKVRVTEAAVTLEGDRPRLIEIWQNLVENACKFMGNQPQPEVEIGVDPRGAETVFFVRDNGSGIDPRYQAKVFGLFEQINPKGEGTGMGLALVKRIVELYGGRIWVESAGPGQGANFLFTLPGAVMLRPKPLS